MTDRACVLVVDDDPDIREAMRDFLEESGFSVACAADGAEALDYLSRHRTGDGAPCVVLLDVMMPRMDGREFRRRQLLDPELLAIPVVLVTADQRIAGPRMTVHEESGAWDLFGSLERVAKPFDIDQLVAVVQSYCKHVRAG